MAREKEDRVNLGSTLRRDLDMKLTQINKITKIPKTKLLDEAIELLVEKRINDLIEKE